MCAGKHQLSKLTAVVDYNKMQSAGPTQEIQDLEPLAAKWSAFGFAVTQVDGHDVAALRSVFCRPRLNANKPSAVICHTVKGKGIPFAENNPLWHHLNAVPPDLVDNLYAALA